MTSTTGRSGQLLLSVTSEYEHLTRSRLHLEQLGTALLQLFFLCLHWLQTVLAKRSRSERTMTAVLKLILP